MRRPESDQSCALRSARSAPPVVVWASAGPHTPLPTPCAPSRTRAGPSWCCHHPGIRHFRFGSDPPPPPPPIEMGFLCACARRRPRTASLFGCARIFVSGRSPLCRARGPAGGGKRPGEGRSVGGARLQSFPIKLSKFFLRAQRPTTACAPLTGPTGPPRAPLGRWGRVGAGGGASPSGSPPRKPTFSGGRYPGVWAQTPV